MFSRLLIPALALIWVGVPVGEFLTKMLRQYQPLLGRYVVDIPSMHLLREWATAPELRLLGQIAISRLWIVCAASLICIVLTCVLAGVLEERSSKTLMRLMIIGFFVPPIIKTLAWSNFFHDFVGWETIGVISYVVVTYLAWYYGPYRMRLDLAGRSSALALDELVGKREAMVRKFMWSAPSIGLGIVVVYSLLVFSGDELRRFGTDVKTLGDLIASLDPGRDRALEFALLTLCVASVAFAAAVSLLARSITGRGRGS